MAEEKLKLRKVGKRPAADAVAEDVPHIDGVLAKDLRRILLTSDDLRGARGVRGDVGETGRRGRRGLRGETGEAGTHGVDGKSIRGVDGVTGLPGAPGEHGRQGSPGPQGIPGPKGNAPAHKWSGTKLSFEQPDGSFGRAVNLQGPAGGRGGTGNAVKETWQSIALVGTDLVFEKLTAGPLGKSTIVDLSSLAGGGGTTVDALTVEPILGDILTLEQSGAAPDRIADTSDFLWKLGKPGGQLAFGGTDPGDQLILQGSGDADRGRNVLRGGANVEWDWTTDSDITALRFQNTVAASGNLISSNIFLQNNIGVNNGVFIMSALDDNSTLTWSVAPGFAVNTLFFARQNLRSSTPGVAPAQSYVYAAQCQYWLTGAGAATTSNYRAVSFAPIIRVDNSGDDMRITNTTGIIINPLFNTRNALATADFGTIRGVHMSNASAILFGQSLGAEIADNWIGLDCEALTGLVVSGVRAAVRSNIPALANNYLIQNTGGAESEFGFGDIHLNDDTWLKIGNTLANPDVIVGWQATQASLVFSTFFGLNANPLYLRPTNTDTWTFQQNNAGTADIGLGFNVNAISFGVVVPTPNALNWFVRFEGPNNRQAFSAGVYSDVWWTAGGTIDVNGQALTEVNSFRIDANVTALNGGTVQDQSGLFIAGMGFPGSGAATRIQALRVTGRARVDGAMNHGSLSPAQITANQNDYQLGISNAQRSINLLDSDAAYNITGIDSTSGANTYGQPGDRICLHNVGAFNLTLTNQDVLSAAANRIITSTGVAYILGPNECVWLWYDDAGANRWRMQEGTGA